MKFQLELNCVEDGRTFLNYWDAAHGNDVVCEVIDGRLLLQEGEDEKPKKISLTEFIELVEASNAMRTV